MTFLLRTTGHVILTGVILAGCTSKSLQQGDQSSCNHDNQAISPKAGIETGSETTGDGPAVSKEPEAAEEPEVKQKESEPETGSTGTVGTAEAAGAGKGEEATEAEAPVSEGPKWEPLIQEAPAALPEIQDMMASIPLDFTPGKDREDLFKACKAEYEKARQVSRAVSRFGRQQDLEPAEKAQIEDIKKELRFRMKPVLYHYLVNSVKTIPGDLRGLSKQETRQLKAKVANGIREAQFFLRQYPKAEDQARIRFCLGRMLFLSINIAKARWIRRVEQENGEKPSRELRSTWKEQYLTRVVELLDAALEQKDLPGWMEASAVRTKANALSGLGERVKAAKLYLKHLEKWPESTEAESCLDYISAARSYLSDTPVKAREILIEAMESCGQAMYFPQVVNFYYKSLTATGRLKEAEKLWLKYMPVFLKRAKEGSRKKFERRSYRNYGQWALFRLAYTNFALLRYEKAKQYFRQHLNMIEDLRSKNITVSPALQVFGQRSTYLLDIMQNKIGMPAPELKLGELWAFDRSFSIEKNAGKVIAVVFRSYGGVRVKPALQFLQELYEEYGEGSGPLAVVTVSYLKGSKDLPGQLEKVEAEMKDLGLSYPAGLDPSKEKRLFREEKYNVNVGSATLVLIDPLGRLAYYEQDPRPHAFGLIKAVIERLLEG